MTDDAVKRPDAWATRVPSRAAIAGLLGAAVSASSCGDRAPQAESCIGPIDTTTTGTRGQALSADADGCLDGPLELDADGHVTCVVLASGTYDSDFCACAGRGLAPASEEHTLAGRRQLGERVALPCQQPIHCFCELTQLDEPELTDCRAQTPVEWERRGDDLSGWCYVEPGAHPTTPAATDPCAASTPRIRTLGEFLRPAVLLCAGPT